MAPHSAPSVGIVWGLGTMAHGPLGDLATWLATPVATSRGEDGAMALGVASTEMVYEFDQARGRGVVK
ncbi:hypothetical protein GCM10010411_71400 [Actinomadura fulvescens]|uniref:Uncharacterized protein n=1 Tax=Actinomadura fulvescens TaxID=46160 RepID=A0ABP6CND0_9ACTN